METRLAKIGKKRVPGRYSRMTRAIPRGIIPRTRRRQSRWYMDRRVKDVCLLHAWPTTAAEYWITLISRNETRDIRRVGVTARVDLLLPSARCVRRFSAAVLRVTRDTYPRERIETQSVETSDISEILCPRPLASSTLDLQQFAPHLDARTLGEKTDSIKNVRCLNLWCVLFTESLYVYLYI